MRKNCLHCGKPVNKPGNKFCSIYCSGVYIGLPSRQAGARRSPHYKQWKFTVLKRDNSICQMCGRSEGDMHIHHIDEFAKQPEKVFQVDNGITLCPGCHNSIRGKEADYKDRFLAIIGEQKEEIR